MPEIGREYILQSVLSSKIYSLQVKDIGFFDINFTKTNISFLFMLNLAPSGKINDI